jgi:hypothetical protein
VHNACLMIAASASPDANSGILTVRKGLSDPVEMKFASANGTACRALVQERKQVAQNLDRPVRHFGPLSDRGWTFQENVLSPRVIHYTDTGLIREYSRNTVLDDGNKITDSPSQSLSDDVSDLPLFPERLWWDLVELYSGRTLIFWSDRLPAFSGLAKRFSTNMSTKYLAGLWEQTLVQHLAWKTDWSLMKDHESVHHIRWQRPLPAILPGPSWSWASTNGP